MSVQDAERTELSTERIKMLMAQATERTLGLTLRITSLCKRQINSPQEVQLKNTKPSIVVLTEDGRIGFQIDNVSYMTLTKTGGDRFMAWLHTINNKTKKQLDYGQPQCDFDRCSG